MKQAVSLRSRGLRAMLQRASRTTLTALLLFVLLMLFVVPHLRRDGCLSLSLLKPAKRSSHGLIYDIGMNSGTDSAFYLSQGYRVVAVDANPVLVGQAAGRFVDSTMSGMLTLINVGVVPDASLSGRFGPALPFYVHKTLHVWSSMIKEVGCRNPFKPQNSSLPSSPDYCNKITIPTTSCAQLVQAFGRADYMKIDIEGHDEICFLSVALITPHLLPQYVSVEGVTVQKVDMFEAHGYTKFKFVAQAAVYKKPTDGHESTQEEASDDEHGSGPWGEDARDFELGSAWRTAAEARDRVQQGMPYPRGEWYDMVVTR